MAIINFTVIRATKKEILNVFLTGDSNSYMSHYIQKTDTIHFLRFRTDLSDSHSEIDSFKYLYEVV